VFDAAADAGDAVRFQPVAELTPDTVAAITEQVRIRLLRWFARSGLSEPDDGREMLVWENSGFSLDAAVRIAAGDRAGLERLLRYCAGPPFALERLELLDDERIIDRLPKPQRDGASALNLTPLELIDQLAAELVNRLANAQAAPPSLPRRVGAQLAPARRCHRLRAGSRREPESRRGRATAYRPNAKHSPARYTAYRHKLRLPHVDSKQYFVAYCICFILVATQ